MEVTLAEENSLPADKKFCTIRAVFSGNNFLVTRFASTCEKAILKTIQDLEIKIGNNMHTFSPSDTEKR